MPDLTALPADLQTIVWWLLLDILIVSVAVVALLTTIKQIAKRIDKARGHCLDQPIIQILLEAAPLGFGIAFGVVPGLFDGFSLPLQAVLGLISGFMSPSVYGWLKKRFPSFMVSKDGRGTNA